MLSLDQTNEQGEALSETVADGNQARESDAISARENPQEAKRRITESKKLSPVQKKIVDLFNQDLSPSEVIRKLGKRFGAEGHEYMSKEEFQHQIVAIRTIAEEEGVLYSRKRGTEGTPSKKGYTVINVNNQAGQQFNNAHGVVATPELIYKVGDVPVEKPVRWIIQKCKEYALNNGIIGEHITPALGDDVSVSVGGIKNILNHFGSDIKNNLIAYIPEMLKNAVLVQTESNGSNLSHLLSTKVRYGDERFIVGMVIHENNGKYYYDHELIEIKKRNIAAFRALPG